MNVLENLLWICPKFLEFIYFLQGWLVLASGGGWWGALRRGGVNVVVPKNVNLESEEKEFWEREITKEFLSF